MTVIFAGVGATVAIIAAILFMYKVVNEGVVSTVSSAMSGFIATYFTKKDSELRAEVAKYHSDLLDAVRMAKDAVRMAKLIEAANEIDEATERNKVLTGIIFNELKHKKGLDPVI